MDEVIPIINSIRGGEHQNLLFQGPAGCGKTTIAKMVAKKAGHRQSIQIPVKGNINWGKIPDFWVNIIDEIHEFKQFENLYPLMDAGENTFLFCTTEYGEAPEPFLSRCIRFTFEPYILEDLVKITRLYSKARGYTFRDKESYRLIAEAARGSPRLAKQRFDRIKRMLSHYGQIPNAENVKFVLNRIGIYNFGYTAEDMRYMEYLKSLPASSLDNLSRALRIDKNTIAKEIEPYLLEKGNILITSKGRKFIKWPDIE